MIPTLPRLATACTLMAGAALFVAPASIAEETVPAFSIPAREVDITGAKYVKTSRRILLPTVNVEVMNWGKITSVTQTSALQMLGGASNSTARSTMEVAVASDVAMLRGVADELYADLAAKLRAGGWEVITHEEAKADPALSGVRQEPVDEKLGAPVRKVNLGKQKMHYTIATPAGMPAMNHGMTAPMWGLRHLLKDRDAHGIETIYRFDPVALQAGGRHGIGSNTASTNAEANLMLSYAQAVVLTNKGAGSMIRLKNGVPVVGGIGVIKKASDASPELANGLSKALSFIAGGSISAKKGLYVCDLDQAALKKSLLVAGRGFNDQVVKALATP